MEDIQDTFLTVDADTDTVPVALSALYKVSRNGIGLRIVDLTTATVNVAVRSFQWRFFNPWVVLAPSVIVQKAVQHISITEYRTILAFSGTVLEGTVFTFVFEGVSVTYVSIAGDGPEQVRDGVKSLVDAETYPDFTATSASFFGGNYLLLVDAITATPPPSSIFVYAQAYYYSKSGLYTTIDGQDYIIVLNENVGYPITAIPALDPSYDFGDLILAGDLTSYLMKLDYPVEDIYLTAAVGTADIDNTLTMPVLGPNDVILFDNTLTFGQPFIAGIPEFITIIYK